MPLFLALILLTGIMSFMAGILLPLLSLEKLYFFTETPSLLQIVAGLWQSSDVVLAVIVALFSILFPAVKFLVLLLELVLLPQQNPKEQNALKHMWVMSRWSMMDVLLVALVIFAAKTSGLATAVSQPGLWFYAYAVLASAIAATLIKRLVQSNIE